MHLRICYPEPTCWRTNIYFPVMLLDCRTEIVTGMMSGFNSCLPFKQHMLGFKMKLSKRESGFWFVCTSQCLWASLSELKGITEKASGCFSSPLLSSTEKLIKTFIPKHHHLVREKKCVSHWMFPEPQVISLLCDCFINTESIMQLFTAVINNNTLQEA